MKKLVALVVLFLFLFTFVPVVAAPRTIDLDTMTVEELMELQEQIKAALQKKNDTSGNLATVTISAKDLLDAYDKNTVAADLKYNGKLIAVSGYVSSTSKGLFDEIIVHLNPKKDDIFNFTTVMCYMNESEIDKVVSLEEGDLVTIIGTGDGEIFGSVTLKDCIFE